tara:strand:- start:237 stop:1472 length:1236 start_codon:yes stop_codon:yes gene_type:complete
MIKIKLALLASVALFGFTLPTSAQENSTNSSAEPSAAMKRYQDVWDNKNPYDNEFYSSFSYKEVKGLEMEVGVSRRDASQIMKVGDLYYVYYTKVVMKKPPVGYAKSDETTPANTWDLADIFYATSKDTYTWKEQGLAVPRGPKGEFDDRSVFTPGVLEWEGKYYLYYQAIQAPYTQRSKNVIGMSWADSPAGPWHRHPEPVLTPGKSGVWKGTKPIRSLIEKEGGFDSLKVHDPYLLVFNGKIHLYYKAHPMGLGISSNMKLSYPDFSGGLATADSPFGPFTKHPQNPVLNSGHEVVLWPYKSGIAALVTANGPEKNTIQWSPDGVNFEIKAHIVLPPDAAGPYVPDAYTDTKNGQGITWGISHIAQRKNQPYPHLMRFQTDLTGANKNKAFKRENIRFNKDALIQSDKR